MKVLHIFTGSINGGAARGAFWLHKGLLAHGVESRILNNSFEKYEDPRIATFLTNKKSIFFNTLHKTIDEFPLRYYPQKKDFLFSTAMSGFDITKHPFYAWSDVIHLHWINGGFINIKDLKEINKPIVWTMRDMWPVTGGCHVTISCKRYELGCGCCPHLNSNKENDLSRKIIKRKEKYIPKNTVLVGISPWMAQIARKSYLYRDFDIRMIFNNVDTDIFFPIGKKNAREVLDIKTDKKIIAVGAQYIKDHFKGFQKFLKALEYLDKDKYFILFFGRLSKEIEESISFEYKYIGLLNDDISIRTMYSCANVYVTPSLIESFGKTIVESMCCGTPVVCFDATGQKSIVEHKITGYKAKPYDEKDFANGIDWIVDNPSYTEMSHRAREKAVQNFNSNKIAEEYKKLYHEILKNE